MWKFLALLLFLPLAVMPQHARAASASVVKMQPVIGGLWNAYAPTVLNYQGKERMWIGGWATEADQGEDLIYYMEKSSGGTWSRPVVSFKKPGFSVNDPTVIQHPVQAGWLFMYYTALNNKDKSAADMLLKNTVGFASSVDGGKTWTDHGLIITQDNGYNKHGAWAPSVVLAPAGNEFWIYYHTNSPSIILLRTRFNINGWQPLGKAERVLFPQSSQQTGRVNVDVTRFGNTFHMLANEFTLSNIGYYTSMDGLIFKTPDNLKNPLMSGGVNTLLTPHLKMDSDKIMQVYFGYGVTTNPCSKAWLKKGITDIKCSDSLHQWTIQLP